MGKPKTILFPYDPKTGALLNYTNADMPDQPGLIQGHYGPVSWENAKTFNATLVYVHHEHGRSAFTSFWKAENKQVYPVFASRFDDFMNKLEPVDSPFGKVGVKGTFKTIKRGSNYGIEFA